MEKKKSELENERFEIVMTSKIDEREVVMVKGKADLRPWE